MAVETYRLIKTYASTFYMSQTLNGPVLFIIRDKLLSRVNEYLFANGYVWPVIYVLNGKDVYSYSRKLPWVHLVVI